MMITLYQYYHFDGMDWRETLVDKLSLRTRINENNSLLKLILKMNVKSFFEQHIISQLHYTPLQESQSSKFNTPLEEKEHTSLVEKVGKINFLLCGQVLIFLALVHLLPNASGREI